MSQEAAIDVLGLGCTAVDDLLYVSAYPTADSKVPVLRRERQRGGLTAIALLAAARLGSRCAFAGVLGEDADSRFVADSLSADSVDLTHVIRRPEARPIRSTVIVDETKQTRTILYDLSGSVGADPALPADNVIRAARVLFVDHYGIEGMTRAARIATAAGIPVVGDLERDDWPGFAQLLDLVDHLIVSRAFATKLTGIVEPEGAIRKLWTDPRQAVVVTGGEEGCWYRGRASGVRQLPAFHVEVVDTTGCGDVFHGAYASALARGLDLEERMRWAAAAAALKATQHGAQKGIPTQAAVAAFLARRGG
jgi:sulfofructose kinase